MDSIAVSESPGQFLQVNKINNKDPELSFILEDLKEEISDITAIVDLIIIILIIIILIIILIIAIIKLLIIS